MKKIILSLYFVNLLAYAGDGVGTRGTGIRSSEKGIGTRGSSLNPSEREPQLDTMFRKPISLSNRNIFDNHSLIIEEIFSIFISSMIESFKETTTENGFYTQNFSNWAASNAGRLTKLFEMTSWHINTTEDELNNISKFEYTYHSNFIEVSGSPNDFNQQLRAGFLTATLVEFFLYANAPFSAEEISRELYSFEESYMKLFKVEF